MIALGGMCVSCSEDEIWAAAYLFLQPPDEQYPRNWTGPVLAGHITGLTNVGFDAAMHRLPIVEWRDVPDSWLGTGSRWSSGIRV